MWSCFLACLLALQGTRAAFSTHGMSPLFVGFCIGLCSMLAQLFAMLMCIFFILGSEAQQKSFDTETADKVMAAFALINFVFFSLWAIALSQKR